MERMGHSFSLECPIFMGVLFSIVVSFAILVNAAWILLFVACVEVLISGSVQLVP
jgi:hypothetical protein